jgi:cytochrome P450
MSSHYSRARGGASPTTVQGGDRAAAVPSHTAVLFSPYLLHHDPRWWDRPDHFDPQRWLDTRPPHAPYAYLPFGAGPRVCLGLHLGQLLLVRTAAHIATAFDLHLIRQPPAVPPKLATLLAPTGLTCALTPRGLQNKLDSGARPERALAG